MRNCKNSNENKLLENCQSPVLSKKGSQLSATEYMCSTLGNRKHTHVLQNRVSH